MIIRDVMTKNPISVTESTSITDAKNLMKEKNISKLPVLNGNKKLVGLITKNDIAKASPSQATTLDMYEISSLLAKLTCGQFMTKKVISIDETQVVEEAARIMSDKNIGCLPVLKDDVLVGIVTESDLFQLFVSMFGARDKGVRANFKQPDKPGELAKIFAAIADNKGNLISVVTREEATSAELRRVTIKATGISLDKVKSILEGAGSEIIDIREI